ncbi:MAG: DNA repair exonuclease [Puia sp.]|nr:DNA repair exonuclease [Puia sp.]
MPLRILAAADLHLGRVSSGLPGDALTLSTIAAWDKMVEWAITNQVDAISLSGDVVDKDNGYYESTGPLQRGFTRLGEADIHVFLVAGNHDYRVLPSLIGSQYQHVHLLGRNGTWEVYPFTRKEETVQFLGWSYPSQYVPTSPLPLPGTMALDPNSPVVGLLHGDLENIGSYYCPVGHNELVGVGVGTWILGHIHMPGEWYLPGTSIHYPGSLQAMSAKEPGAHGFLLLTFDKGNKTVQKIPFSTVRYQSLDVDITGAERQENVWELLTKTIADDTRGWLPELDGVTHLSYDLRLIGEHPQEALVLKWAGDSQREMFVPVRPGTNAFVRSVRSDIGPVVNMEELARDPSPAGALASMILAIREKRSSPLLRQLETQWVTQQGLLRTSGVYQPLLETPVDNSPDAIRKNLLRECTRLLNALLSQVEKKN